MYIYRKLYIHIFIYTVTLELRSEMVQKKTPWFTEAATSRHESVRDLAQIDIQVDGTLYMKNCEIWVYIIIIIIIIIIFECTWNMCINKKFGN